jgi:hypothetical protein
MIHKIVLSVVNVVNNCVMMPIGKWCARGLMTKMEPLPALGPYTEAVPYINLSVLLAVRDDMRKVEEESKTEFQSVLNACMEVIRTDNFRGPMMLMFADLIQRYDPIESMVRISANWVHLGMYLERRITK